MKTREAEATSDGKLFGDEDEWSGELPEHRPELVDLDAPEEVVAAGPAEDAAEEVVEIEEDELGVAELEPSKALMVVLHTANVKEMRKRFQTLMPGGAPLCGTKAEVCARLRQYEQMRHGKGQLEDRFADRHGRLLALPP